MQQSKRNVLIVDDDKVFVEWARTHLRAKGYNVIVGFDAMQATMSAQRTELAAVLLDIGLPGGTGLEVLKRLKASTKTHAVPVIVVTGSGDPNISTRVRELGADSLVYKPLEFEELYSALCHSLGEVQP